MDKLVLAGESASNTGGSEIDAISKGNCMATVTGTVSDMVSAYNTMDSSSYQQLFALLRDGQRAIDRAVSLQCAMVRIGSSVGSSSSNQSTGQPERVSTGGRNPKLESIKRAASWRKRQIPDGCCYARMLRDEHAESVMMKYREWPSVATLLQAPASSFRPVDDMKDLRIVGDCSAVHVGAPGDVNGFPLLPSFARVAQGLRLPPGSFGAVLRASGVTGSSAALRVTARTAVGGTVDPCTTQGKVFRVGDRISDTPYVFLAGSSEKFVGDGWRESVVRSGRGSLCAFAVPRNSDLTHLAVPLPVRAAWERRAMDGAGAVVFSFLEGTEASVSMLELGLLAKSSKVYVHCDTGFAKADVVNEICRENSIPLFGTVDRAVSVATGVALERYIEFKHKLEMFSPSDAMPALLGLSGSEMMAIVTLPPFAGDVVCGGQSMVERRRFRVGQSRYLVFSGNSSSECMIPCGARLWYGTFAQYSSSTCGSVAAESLALTR